MDDADDTINTPPLYNAAPLGGLALVIESSNFTLSDVTFERFIQGIQVKPAFGEQFPSTLHTGISVPGGPTVNSSLMKSVELADNRITGYEWGTLATPVFNFGAPDISSGNSLEGLHYSGNQIEQAGIGIVIAGGAISAEDFGCVAGIESNTVTGVSVSDNLFATTELGILIADGVAQGTAVGQVSFNSVSVDSVEGNTQPEGSADPVCEIRQDADLDSGASVSDNQVLGAASCE